MPCPTAAVIADLISRNTGPAIGERSWPSLELLRNTSESSRELQASAGELNNSASPPWRGLAVRLTRRPGQRGQHHAPTGIFLGRLDQEFPQRDIDVYFVEFEVEGGLHVGEADEARCSVVLPPLLPQSFAFGEGHLDPAVAAGNGAFDRDFAGHSPNIKTTALGGGFGRASRVLSVNFTSAGYMQRRHRKFNDGYLMGVARCSECWASAVWVEFDMVPYCHELYSRV